MHLQDYLESKGCIVKQGGSGNVYTHCPFCNEDPSKRGRFYIQTNPESENWGLWFCHICNSRGGINQLRAHFGDTPLAESLSGSPIIRAAVDYYSQRLFENLEAYEYLVDKRGMTHEMITKCKFGWSDNSLLTYLLSLGFDLEKIQETGLVNHFGEDFLKYQITIPYLEYGQPTTVRGKNIRGKYMSLPGSTARLYGVDAIRGQDVIYLVAGEFDAAVMQMMGYPCAGVPGENIWKPEWTELVSEAKRIYIIFDPDKAGKAGAEKLATLLGETARVVELPEPTRAGDKIDISSLFVEENWTKEDFDFTISKSKGGILVSPAQAFDRWVEFEANPNKGLRFNIPTLDNEMSHGLIPGAVVTLLGRTNCLAGDTEIVINRAGNGTRVSLEELVLKFNGGRSNNGNGLRGWDLTIPTHIQRRVEDGTIRLVEIKDAWFAGIKETFLLETTCGKSIKATAEHPFLTDCGFKKLKDITVGDNVYVNIGRSSSPKKKKGRGYLAKSGLHFHPYRSKRRITKGRVTPHSTVQLHRLVVEADLNGLDLEEFLDRCRTGPVDGLEFVNPKTHVVHHEDHNSRNNELSNLKLMTHEEHFNLHDWAPNVLEHTGLSEVASIRSIGMEKTYDIEVADDPHNFIANEFVVHNSGKSLLSFNIMHRMKMLRPDLKILLLSLEQTRNEWFERAHRLNNFYNPGASTLDTIAFWQDSLFIVDENRVSEATLELCIDQFNFEMGLKPDLVVVDYLGYYARSFTGEEYARTTSAIMGLKAIAKRHQLVVLAPHQANRSNDMGSEVRLYHAKSSGAVEETSDVALTLWTPDQGVPETGLIQTKSDQSREMMLKMSKSRDGGVNTLCKLQLAPLTLAIVPQGDPLYERAVRERQYWINGYDWRQAVNAYITGDERVEWRAS